VGKLKALTAPRCTSDCPISTSITTFGAIRKILFRISSRHNYLSGSLAQLERVAMLLSKAFEIRRNFSGLYEQNDCHGCYKHFCWDYHNSEPCGIRPLSFPTLIMSQNLGLFFR